MSDQSTVPPELETLHLAVEGMMCQANCGTTVRNALLTCHPDVVEAQAVFSEARAWVKIPIPSSLRAAEDPGDVAAEAVEALDLVGFDAKVIDTTLEEYLKERKLQQQRTISSGGDTRAGLADRTLHIRVEGMMCQNNCARTIERALKALPFCQEAQAWYDQKRAMVIVNDDDSRSNLPLSECLDQALEAIEDVGFDAEVMPSLDDHLANVESNDTEDSSLTGPLSTSLLSESTAAEATCGSSNNRIALQIGGMSCVNCVRGVRQALENASPDIVDVQISLERASVEIRSGADRDVVATEACRAVQAAGRQYSCQVVRASLRENAQQMEDARVEELREWRRLLFISASLTIPMVVIHHGHVHFGPVNVAPSCPLLVMACASTIVQFWVGKRFYQAAWKSLQNNSMGMDFLIVLGTTASYLNSMVLFVVQCATRKPTVTMPIFATSAMLLTFVTLGKFLEAYAKGKTSNALKALMNLQPLQATRVIVEEEDELDENVNIAGLITEDINEQEIRVGDFLKVLPSSAIPADGTLVAVSGKTPEAFIDESTLTGESLPVTKQIGDRLIGSTINSLSALIMKVTARGQDTVLSKIVALMQDAQMNQAPIQSLADRIAGIFAPTVICLSLLTFFGWLFFGRNEETIQEHVSAALLSAIAVVVVACPCALGLATPTAVMVGTGVGARHHLLIKGGAVLERLHSIRAIVLDKTGTLTLGSTMLSDTVSLLSEKDPLLKGAPPQVDQTSLVLWLAVCAENQSEHPLAKAIVDEAKVLWGDDGDITLATQGVVVTEFEVLPGRGVQCKVSKPSWGSYSVRVGNNRWVKGIEPDSPEPDDCTGDDEVYSLRKSGKIAIYISVVESNSDISTRRVIGVFGLRDPIKQEAPDVVAALSAMGVEVWMCTGDHPTTAEAVAEEVGIPMSRVCSQVTPEGKAALVTRLQRSGSDGSRQRTVAAVGDGTNDSIMIKRADVGIAIGAGTEVAVEAADVVLVKSSLQDVVTAIDLSKVVFRRIICNFVWAMGYNVLTLPFAAGAFSSIFGWRLPPEVAGLMMAFSSVSVVTSSLLLHYYRPPHKSNTDNSRPSFRNLSLKREVGKGKGDYEVVAAGEIV